MRELKDSFKAAWRGFSSILIFERTFQIMLFVSFLVVTAMIYFPTTREEKVVLLTMIFAVLGLEIINSVLEKFLNFLQPKYDIQVKIIKDLMASIVLLASLGAAVIGLMVFVPYFLGK